MLSLRLCGGLAVASLAMGVAQADVLAQWTFETSVPTTAGPHAAEGGAVGGNATGFHTSTATVYSNPAGNGSPESFSSNNWGIGDYYQFQTSTIGYQDISFTWDQSRSSTGPRTFDLEWSSDGVTFSTLFDDFSVPENANPPGFWNSTTYFPEYTFPTTFGPAGLNNQTTLYFRLTNQVTPGGTGGTNRVDNVYIRGTLIPEPASLLLLALGGLALLRRK